MRAISVESETSCWVEAVGAHADSAMVARKKRTRKKIHLEVFTIIKEAPEVWLELRFGRYHPKEANKRK